MRKDIKRWFGVLVEKFGILNRPLWGWYVKDIKEVIDCVILHNMTHEVRRDNYNFTDKNMWEDI